MKQLTINDKEYTVKFDYNFYNRLLEDAQARAKNKERDKAQDNANQTDGFNQLILQLIDQDPEAIVRAYRDAIVGKKRPTRSDIEQALADAGVWESKDPYGDLYKELKQDGFLRLKIQHLQRLMKEDIKTSEVALEATSESNKGKKDKQSQDEIQQAKNQVILSRKSYEMFNDFLSHLEK